MSDSMDPVETSPPPKGIVLSFAPIQTQCRDLEFEGQEVWSSRSVCQIMARYEKFNFFKHVTNHLKWPNIIPKFNDTLLIPLKWPIYSENLEDVVHAEK